MDTLTMLAAKQREAELAQKGVDRRLAHDYIIKLAARTGWSDEERDEVMASLGVLTPDDGSHDLYAALRVPTSALEYGQGVPRSERTRSQPKT